MPRKSPELPAPKPAAKKRAAPRRRRASAPGADDEVDEINDEDVEFEQQPHMSRRMSPSDRASAELAAAMRAMQSGKPVFPFPAELKDIHKSYWVEAVNSKPHDYFNAGDIHLLKLFCRVAADIDRLDLEIETEGSVIFNSRGNPIVNPRVLVRGIAETRLLALSSKLRMQPASRDLDNDKNMGAKKKKADSAIRSMRESADDGDDGLLAGSMMN